MFEGLGYILKMLSEPRPRIINLKVEVDSTGRFKTLIFEIENKGKIEAKGCKVEVKAENWEEFGTLRDEKNTPKERVVDIGPDDSVPLELCQLDKESIKIAIFGTPEHPHIDYPVLDKGKTYKIKIRLKGSNFVNKKIYNLKVDLSSWEESGLELGC